jgi:hypothetical protein
MNDYETAKAALAHAMKNPDAFSAEDLNAFSDIVEHGQAAPKYAAPNPMGESGSMFSLPAERSIEQTVETPLDVSMPERKPQAKPFQEMPAEGEGRPRAATIDAYNAFGPAREGEPPLPELGDHSPEGLSAEDAHKKWFESLHDKTLKSASTMRDIYKPPSFIAKAASGPIDVSPMGAIQQSAALIGSAQGIASAEHFHEPSVEEFHRDMYPVLGAHVMHMGKESEQYKQYSDIRWKKDYEEHEAAGKSIIRHEFATENNGPVQYGAHEALHTLEGAAAGVPVLPKLAARAMNGQEGAEELESAGMQSPIAKLAGGLYGGAKLLAPLDMLMGGGLLGEAGSGLGRIARSGAVGGATAAGATAADEALGSQPTSASRIGHNALSAGGIGALAGSALGAFGELPRAYRSKVIDSPDFQSAKAGGAESHWLEGIRPKPGSEIERIQQEASGLGQDPNDLAVSRLRKPLSKAVAKEGEVAKLEHGQATDEFKRLARLHRGPIEDLYNTVNEAHAEQRGPDNRPLPAGPEEAMLRGLKNNVTQITPLSENREFVKVIAHHEDPIVERTKEEYGPDVGERIAKAWQGEKSAEFDRAMGANPTQAGSTNPGGRPIDTQADPVMDLDTMSPSEDDLLAEEGKRINPVNAARYELKRRRIGSRVDKQPVEAEVTTAKGARGRGIAMDPSIPDDAHVLLRKTLNVPEGSRTAYGFEARAEGLDVPKNIGDHDRVIVGPRLVNPSELDVMDKSLQNMVDAGRKVPRLAELQRAIKQARDAAPDIGPFKGARARLTDIAQELPPGTSDFEGAGKRANSVADESGTKEDLLKFLNQDRRRVSEGERAGSPQPLSDSVNRFLKVAEQKGATYNGPTYRGVSAGELEAFRSQGESTHTWSVSKGREGADHFGKGGAVLEIHGGAVPVDGIEGSNTFDEALIPKGTPFTIKGERAENGVRVVMVERAQGKQLTGYSAAQHNYAEASSARELRNRRAGLLPEGKADEAQSFHNTASSYGLPGRAPEIDESLRSAASLADKSKELEFVKQMRAYSRLRGEKLDPAVLGRAALGRLPMQGRTTINALNLHLDPILAGRYLPNAGALGGAAGYSGNRKLQELHPDFDTINRLLNPLGP